MVNTRKQKLAGVISLSLSDQEEQQAVDVLNPTPFDSAFALPLILRDERVDS